MNNEKNKELGFMDRLQKEYKYIKVITLAKKVKIKALKKKFKQCIVVSNDVDIEKEDWTRIITEGKEIHYFFTNLKLLYPFEKMPIFELIDIKK